MAVKINIVIDQGATFERTFDMVDDNNQIIDLTGYTGVGEMRKHYTSNTGYSFTVSLNANNGTVTLSMNNVTTNAISSGRYVYDCEVTDSSNVVSRAFEGIATVTPRVKK